MTHIMTTNPFRGPERLARIFTLELSGPAVNNTIETKGWGGGRGGSGKASTWCLRRCP